MVLPLPLDPRQLAAEIEASVSEFNRLVNLASELGLTVEAELNCQPIPDATALRPVLIVRMLSPL